MIALPPPGSENVAAIALPPPGTENSTTQNPNKTTENDDVLNPPDKRTEKKKNNKKRKKNNEPKDKLFGHLGVSAKPKKVYKTYSEAEKKANATKINMKNLEDCRKMIMRKKKGLGEDLPENIESMKADLLKQMAAAAAEEGDEMPEELKKALEAGGDKEPGWSDEEDYQQPATPEPNDEKNNNARPGFNDQIIDYNDTLPSIDSLSMEQQIKLDRAKKYAMEQSVRNVLMNQEQQAKEMASSESHTNLMRQQALVYMCRVYIGSVYYEVREQHLRRAFGPFGPIKLVNMSLDPLTGKHKGFAFVEFELPEASQLAIEQMNGVLLCGRAIKIGRPTNMPQSMPIVESIVRESQKASRIYVSSIHPDLTVEDIKSVFGAFGPIIKVQLRPCAVTGNHAGYGFIEYETVQAANDAVQSMNLFDLGGQFLRVGKAMSPPEKDLMTGDAWKNPEELYVKKLQESANIGGVTPQVAVAAAKVTTELMQLETVAKKEEAKKEEAVKAELSKPKREGSKFGSKAENVAPITTTVPALTVEQLHAQMNPKDEGDMDENHGELRSQQDRQVMMQKLEASKHAESRVLCLRNMITEEELDDDFEEEVKEECETKYGPVNEVLVYLEKQSEEEDAEILVKVFVEFAHHETAKIAKSKLHGRFFGGKQIVAHYYNMGFYEVDDLSH